MPTQIPLSCDLTVFTPAEREAHLALARQVTQEWPAAREETPEGLRLRYRGGDAARFLDLARFAANEHRCCPWLRFTLTLEPAPPGQPADLQLQLSGSLVVRGQGFEP